MKAYGPGRYETAAGTIDPLFRTRSATRWARSGCWRRGRSCRRWSGSATP